MTRTRQETVQALLWRHGRTFASEAGIRVARHTPAPLFQLLCLSLLFSARIRADIAVAAMRSLLDHGWSTPQKLIEAGWKARVDVLNRSGYARYDERTSTMLEDSARHLLNDYGGDLRRLRQQSARKPEDMRRRLKEFKGIGDVGAEIFFREVQGLWPELMPFVDARARQGAERLDLPTDPAALARLVDPADFPRLVAALVRIDLLQTSRATASGSPAG